MSVKRALCLMLLMCVLGGSGTSNTAASTAGKQHPATTLWDEIKRFAGNKTDMVDAYQQLHTRDWGSDTSLTDQILSMSDAMLGRYDQAKQEMDAAFRTKPSPTSSCPAQFGAGGFGEWLAKHAGRFDLVMVNEAHNQPMSRALIFQMLPVMRRMGFSVFALEALPDKATTGWINRHGYALDEASYGYYLREPIEGEVVREARRLGFTLASYDVFSDVREQDEARNLAQILKTHPGQKVFVVAGYDHIRRMNGRMAELLPKFYEKPFLSIDQLGKGNDVMRSICIPDGSSGDGEKPGVLASMRWVPGVRGTDIAVWRTKATVLSRAASEGNEWLSLGGERWRYRFSTVEGCGKPGICLVAARYANEPANAVPADRYLALGSESFANLYLRNGRYVVTYSDARGVVVRSTPITVQEGMFVP
ncbi:MAG TPA: hypothetical protein VJR95_14395 [Rhodanobacter sp.]|nr:hypothetical protein [Rhodanobacter sp.]